LHELLGTIGEHSKAGDFEPLGRLWKMLPASGSAVCRRFIVENVGRIEPVNIVYVALRENSVTGLMRTHLYIGPGSLQHSCSRVMEWGCY